MKLTALVLTLVLSSGAFAQGVKVKKAVDAAKAKIAKSEAKIKKECGVDIKATLDKSFEADEDSANTGSWCSATLDGIAHSCSDADYKAAIAKAVKAVTCKLDGSLTKDKNYGNAFELKGTTLVHSFNKTSFNLEDKTKEFLKSKM